MRINADFTRRAAVHFDQTDWVPSPAPGVERKMLDRMAPRWHGPPPSCALHRAAPFLPIPMTGARSI